MKLATVTIIVLVSWVLIHVFFAFYYSHEFYRASGRGRSLIFPDHHRPKYWDFIYFSLSIGLRFKVSDVKVTSKKLRRVVLMHAVISFIFYLLIVALAINIIHNFTQ